MFRSLLLLMTTCFVSFSSANAPGRHSLADVLNKRKMADEIDLGKFVDELPRPKVIKVAPGTKEITVTLEETMNQFYRDLPPTKVWSYNGLPAGPLIEVESGNPLRVHWKNKLPTTHLIASDDGDMPGMEIGSRKLPEVRSVTHMHGAIVPMNDPMDRLYNNDGWPDAWNVPGQEQIADYPNNESARMLWFHDHAMGSTSRSVYAGLAGLYIVRDAFERSLNLPKGDFELPLVFTTKGFNNDGTLYYPRKITLEVYGSSVPVNGKVWPYFNAEPRKYRFRMLNAANSRTIAVKIIDAMDETAGPALYQIGSDGGFLEKPVVISDPAKQDGSALNLMPGERADVIVDFSAYAGKTLLVKNVAIPDDMDAQFEIPEIMLIKVGQQTSSLDVSVIPTAMKPIKRHKVEDSVLTRKIVIGEISVPGPHPPLMTLNGKIWDEFVEERPVLGTTEIWEIVNTLPDNHPFHLHLVQFQALDRREYDVDHYLESGEIKYTGSALAPEENEMGWKDTLKAPTGHVTRIIAKFEPYSGSYVYHCHILEHEDMGMMRPFIVVTPPKSLIDKPRKQRKLKTPARSAK